MKTTFDDTTFELEPTENGYSVILDGRQYEVHIINVERGKVDFQLDGQRLSAYITADGPRRWVTINGRTNLLTQPSTSRRRGSSAEGDAVLTAPMPGQVRVVNVSEGEAVTRGQTLLVIEAMKMEIRVQAPQDGLVKKLFVKQGDTVEREQLLVDIELPEKSSA